MLAFPHSHMYAMQAIVQLVAHQTPYTFVLLFFSSSSFSSIVFSSLYSLDASFFLIVVDAFYSSSLEKRVKYVYV